MGEVKFVRFLSDALAVMHSVVRVADVLQIARPEVGFRIARFSTPRFVRGRAHIRFEGSSHVRPLLFSCTVCANGRLLPSLTCSAAFDFME